MTYRLPPEESEANSQSGAELSRGENNLLRSGTSRPANGEASPNGGSKDAGSEVLPKKRYAGGGMFFACFTWFREFFYNHTFLILHICLAAIAYGYLFVIIGIFFLQRELPKIYPEILDSFSDPYLGILGIYVLVQEMRHRQAERTRRLRQEAFIIIWVIFLGASSVLTFFSEYYHFNVVYQMIITNSLAAVIIRVGAWLHF